MLTYERLNLNGMLPSMNTTIQTNRYNCYAGARLERDYVEQVRVQVWSALKKGFISPAVQPCIMLIEFNEPDRRRDADNVESAAKFILDGCVRGGWLSGDDRSCVVDVQSRVVLDKRNKHHQLVTVIQGKAEELYGLMDDAWKILRMEGGN